MSSDDYFGYYIQELIGSGSCGEVYKAYHYSTKEEVVLKKISKNNKEVRTKRIRNEIKAGIALREIKGVARYLEDFQTSDSYCLIFEFIRGKNFFDFMEENQFAPIPEEEIRGIVVQLLDILKTIHSKGIAHKDIKLENIMYNPNTKQVTLVDFGFCSFITDGRMSRDYCGSIEYTAPEIRASCSFLPEKADVWSLGITIFAMVYGCFPFSPSDFIYAKQTGYHPLPRFPSNSTVSKEIQDLLGSMLQIDPSRRGGLQTIATHAWLVRKKENL